MAEWQMILKSGAFRLLQIVDGAGAEGISPPELAIQAGMTNGAGTFNSYLSLLRSNGLVERGGEGVVTSRFLFPEES